LLEDVYAGDIYFSLALNAYIETVGWFRNWEGGRPTATVQHRRETPGRPRTCFNNYQWSCERGTNAVSF